MADSGQVKQEVRPLALEPSGSYHVHQLSKEAETLRPGLQTLLKLEKESGKFLEPPGSLDSPTCSSDSLILFPGPHMGPRLSSHLAHHTHPVPSL